MPRSPFSSCSMDSASAAAAGGLGTLAHYKPKRELLAQYRAAERQVQASRSERAFPTPSAPPPAAPPPPPPPPPPPQASAPAQWCSSAAASDVLLTPSHSRCLPFATAASAATNWAPEAVAKREALRPEALLASYKSTQERQRRRCQVCAASAAGFHCGGKSRTLHIWNTVQ